jgi:hypothetical protein
MTNPESNVVFLESESVGLIVLAKTGILFENQTGGYACIQDRAEGFYVPLSHQVVDHYEELHRYFLENAPAIRGDGIDHGVANFIDAELSRLPGHAGIAVDRNQLSTSREAWVHVVIKQPTIGLLFRGFSEALPAILVWPNSD